ncbi:CASP-like protein 4B1 [Juglans microcarpa x Juglans regia]|uniref:CASP-like protein 4B1 n=1 Tax=Juglans microcarpa x Juglans regia TaxID=2249226 RepID=UPI001B7F1E01|nr:CASP-like protein 4B1 [Juglans microcarpa x Juglans regia]
MSDSDHGYQTTKQDVGSPTMNQPAGHDHQDPASESDIGNSRTGFIANPVDTPNVVEVENQHKVTKSEVSDKIVRRWKREDLIKKGSLATSVMAFLFSLLAFIIMASDKHGDWKQFDKWAEYRYVLAVAILSTLYAGGQTLRQVHELRTRKTLLQQRTSAFLNFFGDQIMAYLLISAASAAIPQTNRLFQYLDDETYLADYSGSAFTEAAAAAISMAFLAFLSLAVSAMISGYKLSTSQVL